MLIIPTQPVPSQTLSTSVGGQAATLNIYAKGQGDYAGLYMDVISPAIAGGGICGALCYNASRVIRYPYLGFAGDLAWFDTQGSDDPLYTGLGARWFLAYLAVGEL